MCILRCAVLGAALAAAPIPCFALRAGTPDHLWSRCYGSPGTSTRAFGVAVDAAGSVVIAGSFTGTVNFGGSDLVAQGTDIVLAKYNAAGAHVWSKRLGGAIADQAYAVAVDDGGNLLVTGYFQGTANFGGVTLTSAGHSDIFVAKYDANGNHVWSTLLGGVDADIGYAIATDHDGNVFVGGYIHGIVPSDILLAKYNAAGAFLWIKAIGGPDYDEGLALDVDGSGNVLLTGYFTGTTDFGGGPLSTPGEWDWDVFVVKYAPDGAHLWSQRFGNSDLEAGLAIKADAQDNVTVTGYFSGTVNFGGADLTATGDDVDIFLARYDANGAHLWSRRCGGLSYETGTALAVDASSNVFLAGYFSGNANFGGTDLMSAGNIDIFFAEYRADGTHVSSQRHGGTAADVAQSIAVDGAGNRYMAGYFEGSVDFGGGPLVSSGTPDMFLVKYGAVVSAAGGPPLEGLSLSAAPNPFNPATTLHYRIPAAGRVVIDLYDVRGRRIATLLDDHRSAGAHRVAWNGRDRDGRETASGVYFARIVHGDKTRTLKLLLLK